MPSQIIYPGTFNPITNGHLDIIDRALRMFDKVIVAVALNTKKNPLLDFEERFSLVKASVEGKKNIEVCQYSGLLVEFAREKNIFKILRGLRAVSDFEYELMLAGLNRKLEPRLETIFLTATDQYAYLTSSMVREIASLNGDIEAFVPAIVAEALQAKFQKT